MALQDQVTFRSFLLHAKRQTYADQGGTAAAVPPWVPGTRQLEYREGPWVYRDIYYGSVYFAGQETVYFDAAPVWTMVYAGGILAEFTGVLDTGPIYDFLQAALREAPAESPYRGPARFAEGEFVYTNQSQGDVSRFWGVETIWQEGQPVYDLRYSGGRLD